MEKKDSVIFLIDDDEDDHEIFNLALKRINPKIKCFSAFNGCEALDMFKNGLGLLPDYVFIDLNMPKMGGKECLVELQKLPQAREIPIIIYSTSVESIDKIAMMNHGASSFITKPSELKELVKILSLVFQHTHNK